MNQRCLAVALLAVAGLAMFASRADAETEGPIVPVTITASSEAKGRPAAWSLSTSFSRADGTKWCANKGDGTGESITFAFGSPTAVSVIRLSVGVYRPMPSAFPNKLEITAGRQKLSVDAADAMNKVDVKLDGSAIDSVAIKIVAMSEGKAGDACISGVKFQTATDDEWYRPLAGIEQAGVDALADFTAKLDAAFKACDAAALGAAIAFPLVHQHFAFGNDGDTKAKKTKYKAAKQLVAACKKKGSLLKLGFGSGEVADGKDLAHPRSLSAGEVLLGYYPPSDYNYSWVLRWKDGAWALTSVSTAK